jgi:D-beta-D-heptose 7-phosphate kinase/D-beta-D-heptose 1-phosphate adenosyltransferase
MGNGRLVVVGDVLLDREVFGSVERLCPEAPVPVLAETSTVDRPGGAGLAALLAALPDEAGRTREVVLIAAFSADEAGRRLRQLLADAGVRVIALALDGPTPEKIRMRAGGHLLMRLDRGDGGGTIGRAPAAALAALRQAGAVLVSDYGRGITSHPQLRAALADRAHRGPVVWDPHPRGAPPVPATRLVTPNQAEAKNLTAVHNGPLNGHVPAGAGNGFAVDAPAAATGNGLAGTGNGFAGTGNGFAGTGNGFAGTGNGFAGTGNGFAGTGKGFAGNRNSSNGFAGNGNGRRPDNQGPRAGSPTGQPEPELAAVAAAAIRLRRYWSVGAVAVTVAERGAVLSDGVNPPLLVPVPYTAHGDSCGAGDRFASAAGAALADGATPLAAVTAAVAAATGYVAAGGAVGLTARAGDRMEEIDAANAS